MNLNYTIPDDRDRFPESYHVRITGFDDGSEFESGLEARTVAQRLYEKQEKKTFKDRSVPPEVKEALTVIGARE